MGQKKVGPWRTVLHRSLDRYRVRQAISVYMALPPQYRH